jgi:simple sugar transport system permease protein
LGFFAAGAAGILFAIMEGFFVLLLRVDQIITGTAINLLAAGVAPFVTKALFDSTGSTPSLPLTSRFSVEPLYLTALLIFLIGYWFHFTRSGLAVQFAGEAPEALAVSGSSVGKTRWYALLTCGMVGGFGGATLSIYLSSAYSANMTGGRGFIALAALIFGRWRPLPTLFACLFFAFTDALQIRLQGASSGIPVQFIQILPYLFTVIALAGFFGQSRAPKAIGKHWDAE